MSALYVGGDVSKGYADFAILDEHGGVVEPAFRLDDTSAGHKRFVALLTALLRRAPGAQCYVGFESTGGYENNWLGMCERAAAMLPVRVARINPKPVRRHLDARMKRTVTDEVSAYNIAEYMIRYPENVLYDQDDPFYPLRRQWSYLRLLKKQVTQARNQLHGLLYGAHPQLLRYCRDGIPGWVLHVLARYPVAAQLARARVSTVARIPYVTPQRAEELIQDARNSVGAQQDEVTRATIEQLLAQIEFLATSVEQAKKRIERACNHPAVDLLQTFEGIGKLSAVGLMINIRDHRLFPDAKHLASYFGLHPVYRKSGDGTWGMHMSKEGRVEPREVLFMVAWAAIRCNPHIRHIYEQKLSEGMKPMAAVGLCMHKILRIVYGMLLNNTPYNPQIDRCYRKRHLRSAEPPHADATPGKALRFAPHDAKAPISRRQARQRRRAHGSQSSIATECGITVALPQHQNTHPRYRKEQLAKTT